MSILNTRFRRCARKVLLGENTLWKRATFTRGFGTRAARRAMKSSGHRRGQDPRRTGAGHAGSNLLKATFPRMIARDFEPAGYARQVLKDLDMVHDMARTLKVPTPMSSQAAWLFRILVSKGHAEKDGIAVLKLYDQIDTV